MAIRNSKIRGTDYVDGEVLFDYDLDDTNDAIINQFVKNAELGVRILQANNTWTQGPNLLVDEFTDNDGSQNTVNVGSSTSQYDSDEDLFWLSWSDGTDFTDATEYTDTTSSDANNWRTINTYSIGNKLLDSVDADIRSAFDDDSGGFNFRILYTYFDSSTNTSSSISSNNTYSSKTFNNPELRKTVDTIEVQWLIDGTTNTKDAGVKNLVAQVKTFDSSSTVFIDSNTVSLDGNEIGFAVSIPDSDIPTNTSIDVTIGDGSTTLTSTTVDFASKGVVIGNGTDFGGPLSSGTLEVTFTLNTSDTSVTPSIKSYGVDILR